MGLRDGEHPKRYSPRWAKRLGQHGAAREGPLVRVEAVCHGLLALPTRSRGMSLLLRRKLPALPVRHENIGRRLALEACGLFEGLAVRSTS